MEWESRRGRGKAAFMKNRNTTGSCAKAVGGELRAERDLCSFPAFILVFSRYPGASVLITSASNGIPVLTQDLAYSGTTVPVGVCQLGDVVSGPLTA